MLLTVLETLTRTSLFAFAKLAVSMDIVPSGMVSSVMPQNVNAYAPMFVTLPGMVSVFSAEQLENASLGMDFTRFGMFTEVNPVQLENAVRPMERRPAGMTTFVRWTQDVNAWSAIAVID